MPDALDVVRGQLEASADLLRLTAERCAEDIARAAALMAECFRAGGRLYLCGNGGSAAQCQHLAAEFVNRLNRGRERPALPAVALTADTATLTAIGNDWGFEQVFARQVEALGRRGDVLLAITTSGESSNLLAALRRARDLGLHTILIGGLDGRARTLADVAVLVPARDTPLIQEAHGAILHALCRVTEGLLGSASHRDRGPA
ncbi:MAG TPA: SIS domain-containing protein [Gemmatimonadales bacterium]|nr:SIS domain-containing protein [Gemmatimonadales bacterium]